MVNSKATSGSAALTGSNEFSRDRPLLEIKGVSKKFGDFPEAGRDRVKDVAGRRACAGDYH